MVDTKREKIEHKNRYTKNRHTDIKECRADYVITFLTQNCQEGSTFWNYLQSHSEGEKDACILKL